VERMSRLGVNGVVWRRSSYSDQGGGQCLEVVDGLPGFLPVRDSKRPGGPVLVFPAAAWAAFLRR
jgi:hypothetical protein